MTLGLAGLAVICVTAIVWFARAWRVAIPRSATVFQLLWGLGFAAGAFAIYQGKPDPYAGWALGLGLMFLYLVSTGAQKVAEGVKVGDSLPAFSLPDDAGDIFDSATLSGSRVLLKFFRGHW